MIIVKLIKVGGGVAYIRPRAVQPRNAWQLGTVTRIASQRTSSLCIQGMGRLVIVLDHEHAVCWGPRTFNI